jgi:hypothetical protein
MTEPLDEDRERLRTTFGEDAERYDRIRPNYPPALFTDLAPGPRVLEIGPGTGQATPPDLRQQAAAEIPADSAEFDASGRFGPVTFHDYEWDRTYPTDEYIDLLLTYSNHRALRPDRQAGLLDCVRSLIDGYGGGITKRYLTRLAVAGVR